MTAHNTRQPIEGAFTSKFRVMPRPTVIGPATAHPTQDPDPDMQSAQSLLAMKASAKRLLDTHPAKSCSRCYRLKKKCLRDLPLCSLCAVANQECVYTERKVRKRKSLGEATIPVFLVSSESFRDVEHEKPPALQAGETLLEFVSESIPRPQSTESMRGTDSGITSTPRAPEKSHDSEAKGPLLPQIHDSASEIIPDTEMPESRDMRVLSPQALQVIPSIDKSNNVEPFSRDRPGIRHPSTDKNERLRRFASRVDSVRSTKPQRADSWPSTTMHKYSHATNAANAADEFLATKPIGGSELPPEFVAAYFGSYGRIHSFVDEQGVVDTVANTDFSNGLIISVEIYMVLAIGCRLYDYENGTNHFAESFSHKNVDSVLDMLDLGITESTPPDIAACNMRLLLLVILYCMCVPDDTKCQRLLGVASLLAIQLRYYCATDSHAQRIFWLVYILDKHLSLVWLRPLFLPRDAYITIPWLVQCVAQAKGTFTQNEVVLARIRGRVLSRKLGDTAYEVKDLVLEINEWHTVALAACDYDDKWKREQYVHWTNMQQYYLLVEIEQIEPGLCASQKPVMGYLSSSFASVLGEGDGALSPAKSLVWHHELINVVQYSLGSLLEILRNVSANNRLDVSLQLGEANCTLQVLTNLLAFVEGKHKDSSELVPVAKAVTQLQNLSVFILKNNAISCDLGEFTRMSLLVTEIQTSL